MTDILFMQGMPIHRKSDGRTLLAFELTDRHGNLVDVRVIDPRDCEGEEWNFDASSLPGSSEKP